MVAGSSTGNSDSPVQAAGERSGESWLSGSLLVIILFGVVVRLWLMHAAHATEEDFYITLRYVENLAAGRGLVYNQGEPVLGVTTPLYAILLAGFARVGLSPLLWSKLIGIAADVCTASIVCRIGRNLGRPGVGLAAAGLVMIAPTNLIWATKGMEVGIVAAVVTGVWCLWIEKREIAAWALAAILLLLRIDGAALAVVMLAATLVRERRLPWRGIAVFTLVIAPWMLYAAHTYGSPLPLSVSAKLMVYGKLIPGRFPQLRAFIGLMVHNPIGLVCVPGSFFCFVLLLINIARSARPRELAILPALVWMGIYYSGMALSHVVLFGWYFVPPTPILYLGGCAGIAMAASALKLKLPGLPQEHAWAVVASLTIAVGAVTVPRCAATLIEGQRVEQQLRIPIGQWMRENAPPTETLMLEPIGYIGYYSGMRILDVIGLISPEALPSYRANVPSPDHDLWQRLRPDWLLLRAGQLRALTAYESHLPVADRLDTGYHLAKTWSDPARRDHGVDFYLYRRAR